MRIAVLALDGTFDSGLSIVLDVLANANALRENVPGAPPAFEVTPVGVGSSARTGQGLRLETMPLPDLDRAPDLLVVPAVAVKTGPEVIDAVREHQALTWIETLCGAGSALAAACSGTFFLAEAGVLDGRMATTSWWLGPAFRDRYRHVRLDESKTLARDGQVTTAGAAFAHIDLALSIVARQSPALADLVGRFLLTGERRSQAAFAVPALLAAADPTVTAFERWVRDHLDEPLQIGQVAQALSVSERTLQRATSAVLGMSPMDFLQEIRLDQATFLLRTTGLTAEAVAAAVGYQNVGTLRALVRRRRGSSIRALRQGRPLTGQNGAEGR
jgi:transcriptional regulator GlxA family with amidase domain